MSLKSCKFTNTADGHFLIDLHPNYPQVSYAAGFSGHGFKFASVIGEIMADLAERGETRHNIDLFRLERLTSPSTRPSGHASHQISRPHTAPLHPLLSQPHHHRQRRPDQADSYGYSVLAEEGVGAIRPFW
jgi:glycine/D-amino acid oxidase-like deaminating enzyme